MVQSTGECEEPGARCRPCVRQLLVGERPDVVSAQAHIGAARQHAREQVQCRAPPDICCVRVCKQSRRKILHHLRRQGAYVRVAHIVHKAHPLLYKPILVLHGQAAARGLANQQYACEQMHFSRENVLHVLPVARGCIPREDDGERVEPRAHGHVVHFAQHPASGDFGSKALVLLAAVVRAQEQLVRRRRVIVLDSPERGDQDVVRVQPNEEGARVRAHGKVLEDLGKALQRHVVHVASRHNLVEHLPDPGACEQHAQLGLGRWKAQQAHDFARVLRAGVAAQHVGEDARDRALLPDVLERTLVFFLHRAQHGEHQRRALDVVGRQDCPVHQKIHEATLKDKVLVGAHVEQLTERDLRMLLHARALVLLLAQARNLVRGAALVRACEHAGRGHTHLAKDPQHVGQRKRGPVWPVDFLHEQLRKHRPDALVVHVKERLPLSEALDARNETLAELAGLLLHPLGLRKLRVRRQTCKHRERVGKQALVLRAPLHALVLVHARRQRRHGGVCPLCTLFEPRLKLQ